MVALVQPVASPLHLRDPRRLREPHRVAEAGRSVGFSRPTWLPLVAIACVLIALVAGVRIVQGGPADAVGSESALVAPAEAGDIIVHVAEGDTLWSIASVLAGGDDPRPLVVALADRNGGSELLAGQTLIVPAGLVDDRDLLIAQG